MPTRKQRRRRQKTRRHDWEYVYVDEEGQEVEVDPAELRPNTTLPEGQRAKASNPQRRTGARGGQGRRIEPPSWRRVFRRVLFLAPVFIVVMLMLNRDVPVAARVAPAVFLVLFFIPFSYFTDSLAYRMYRKRLERRGGAATGNPKPKPKAR
jgi:hypothetical protein